MAINLPFVEVYIIGILLVKNTALTLHGRNNKSSCLFKKHHLHSIYICYKTTAFSFVCVITQYLLVKKKRIVIPVKILKPLTFHKHNCHDKHLCVRVIPQMCWMYNRDKANFQVFHEVLSEHLAH